MDAAAPSPSFDASPVSAAQPDAAPIRSALDAAALDAARVNDAAVADAAPDYGGCSAREIGLSDMSAFGLSLFDTSFDAWNPQSGRVDFYDNGGLGSAQLGSSSFGTIERSVEYSKPILELYSEDAGADCQPELRFPIVVKLVTEELGTVFSTNNARGYLNPAGELGAAYDGNVSELASPLVAQLGASANTKALDRFHFEAVLISKAASNAGRLVVSDGSGQVRVLDWSAPAQLASSAAVDCGTFLYYVSPQPVTNAVAFECARSASANGSDFTGVWNNSFGPTQIGKLLPSLARSGYDYFEMQTAMAHDGDTADAQVRRCSGFSFTEPCTDMNSSCYTCTDPSSWFAFGEHYAKY